MALLLNSAADVGIRWENVTAVGKGALTSYQSHRKSYKAPVQSGIPKIRERNDAFFLPAAGSTIKTLSVAVVPGVSGEVGSLGEGLGHAVGMCLAAGLSGVKDLSIYIYASDSGKDSKTSNPFAMPRATFSRIERLELESKSDQPVDLFRDTLETFSKAHSQTLRHIHLDNIVPLLSASGYEVEVDVARFWQLLETLRTKMPLLESASVLARRPTTYFDERRSRQIYRIVEQIGIDVRNSAVWDFGPWVLKKSAKGRKTAAR